MGRYKRDSGVKININIPLDAKEQLEKESKKLGMSYGQYLTWVLLGYVPWATENQVTVKPKEERKVLLDNLSRHIERMEQIKPEFGGSANLSSDYLLEGLEAIKTIKKIFD